jgi:hypothetical protein
MASHILNLILAGSQWSTSFPSCFGFREIYPRNTGYESGWILAPEWVPWKRDFFLTDSGEWNPDSSSVFHTLV